MISFNVDASLILFKINSTILNFELFDVSDKICFLCKKSPSDKLNLRLKTINKNKKRNATANVYFYHNEGIV